MTDQGNSQGKARRKQLRQQYKLAPKKMGAYSILNLRADKTYVGVSRDVDARLNRHRFQLRNGSEENSALQADWTAANGEDFEFSVLEVLEPPLDSADYDPEEELQALASKWCQQTNAYRPKGYNPRPR